MENLVSIITPLFNAEKFVESTIKSVLDQTYLNWEMIIVDDCSTDSSVKIVKSYRRSDDRIKLIELDRNSGAAVSRNRAIKEARGRFLAFLDSDDLWHKDKLKIQIEFMLLNQAPFTHTSYTQIDESNNLGKLIKAKSSVTYRQSVMSNTIGCLTVIYDAEFFGKIYMPIISKRQDLGLWLKLLKVSNCIGIEESLAYYRIRQNSISSNKLKLIKYHWILYRKHENLGLFKSIFYVAYYSISKFKNVFIK